MKFKVGDIVRATAHVECGSHTPGDLAVVIRDKMTHYSAFPYAVRYFLHLQNADSDPSGWPVHTHEIELVERPDEQD